MFQISMNAIIITVEQTHTVTTIMVALTAPAMVDTLWMDTAIALVKLTQIYGFSKLCYRARSQFVNENCLPPHDTRKK